MKVKFPVITCDKGKIFISGENPTEIIFTGVKHHPDITDGHIAPPAPVPGSSSFPMSSGHTGGDGSTPVSSDEIILTNEEGDKIYDVLTSEYIAYEDDDEDEMKQSFNDQTPNIVVSFINIINRLNITYDKNIWKTLEPELNKLGDEDKATVLIYKSLFGKPEEKEYNPNEVIVLFVVICKYLLLKETPLTEFKSFFDAHKIPVTDLISRQDALETFNQCFDNDSIPIIKKFWPDE